MWIFSPFFSFFMFIAICSFTVIASRFLTFCSTLLRWAASLRDCRFAISEHCVVRACSWVASRHVCRFAIVCFYWYTCACWPLRGGLFASRIGVEYCLRFLYLIVAFRNGKPYLNRLTWGCNELVTKFGVDREIYKHIWNRLYKRILKIQKALFSL